ncbi:type II secretion system minor pseudopilin GspK [Vibrio cincinnatiensis]|uniref:type II secretion system minor pseudopilin GspK n=1 Tax=Vibrio cincinnatiensis TaxID=675 RepID=UPI001EDD9831|nr:type II secretion system minor pseudopilin GspK [Vibrio cincinnatiensis]MCG3732761.1 general secretion pathway protein GspK [Vibrio cincinnatiensis]MCG3736425.1 general secretion pathway protein GspK [Vibrio cincinnatiensis]MCG3740093.1 general secretion pathway protein GspK [Vibrio cincinnatiensis]MCG3743595.1 general secretion pathway protein GspK [Vibrio cincinnatiensis]
MRCHYNQRGVALIIVLLLLAVMVSIAATMSQRMFSQFQRANHQVGYQQAYWYSIGVEALAKVAIEQSYKDNDTINLNQPWAQSQRTYPLDYGQVTGHLIDKQACFNVNVFSGLPPSNDSAPPYVYRVWRSLLDELDVENYQAETIADATWDFIDADDLVNRTNGAEDALYESMAPAYLAPNGLLVDSSELRAVYQVSGDVMSQLTSYVCALPNQDWRLNINTLAPEQAKLLVAMFSPYLNESNAKDVLESRPFDGWESVDSFLAESPIAAVEKARREEARAYLAVDSQYFELDAQVKVDSSQVRIRSLFYSSNKKDATVIRRRYGGVSERELNRSAE